MPAPVGDLCVQKALPSVNDVGWASFANSLRPLKRFAIPNVVNSTIGTLDAAPVSDATT